MTAGVGAVVLAAGAGSRFGAVKQLAGVGGRPLLERVLDAVASAGIDDVVVVLGAAAPEIERRVRWRSERRVVNPAPGRGLASSVRLGLAALGPDLTAALVLLGDQPLVRPDVIRALLEAAGAADRPIVVPRYEGDGARNPVLLGRAAFGLVDEMVGDRGLGPVLQAHEHMVREVPVGGGNPDVDTPEDLADVLAVDWATRVRADRDQVERVREVPDDEDHYAPTSSLFRADPRRRDDPVLDALLRIARPDETWLDIGAGAGRYALPLALVVRQVLAVEPSPSMRAGFADQQARHHVPRARLFAGRWPPEPGGDLEAALDEAAGPRPWADVALIAHVGYDVEAIDPFLDAMDAAVRRACVAVLMERRPAGLADPFWPLVHGEERERLPALDAFVELLAARGRRPEVERVEREPRRFATREDLATFARRQLWIAEGGEKDRRFRAALDELAVEDGGGWRLRDDGPPHPAIGIVSWRP